MSNEKEEEIKPEVVESSIENVKAPEAVEKKPETLEEEVEGKKSQLGKGIKIVEEKASEYEVMMTVNGALPENIEEFKKEEGNIEKGATEAKSDYVKYVEVLKNDPEVQIARKCLNCGNKTQTGKFCTRCGAKLAKEEVGQHKNNTEIGEKKTKKEILEKVEEINKKLDNALIGIDEVNKLKKQKEQLFDLLDEYKGDYGTEIGKKDYFIETESKIKQEVPKEKNKIIDTKILSDKTIQEIQTLLKDSASELSKAKKTFEFWEEKLAEDEKKLTDLKGKKDNYMTERAKKSLRVNIIKDKGTMKRRREKMEEIIKNIENKNKIK